MRIFLVRHGQTKWNVEQRMQGDRRVPLNSEGKKQAEKLAEKFSKTKIAAIYASPTVRTKQTANIIAQPHNIKIIIDKDLVERVHGVLAGLTGNEMRHLIPDVEQQFERDGIDWRPPGNGETLRELQKRTISQFNRLLKTHKKEDTLILVTPAGNIRTIVHYLHGGKPEDYFQSHTPENAEIVKIVYDGRKCRIVA